MYTKSEKESILHKIENNRDKYELIGEYENHKPVLCMFTDKPVVHVYNELDDYNKLTEENYLIGWAINVKLSNGEWISCITSHRSYGDVSPNN